MHYAKAELLKELDRPIEAIACYDQLIKRDPMNAKFYTKKAKFFYTKYDDKENAIQCYD